MVLTTALNKPTLADTLRELLSNKGLSVSELSRRVHIPQPTLQRITSGTHTKPHAKTLEALANFFGVSLDQLRGFEPIPWLLQKTKLFIRQVPILNTLQAAAWPSVALNFNDIELAVIDIKTSEQAFALRMPDGSMEPLIPKGSLLIIDPKRDPQYRSLVAVKVNNCTHALIRQLIIDAKNCYIKPLSQDFEQFKMALLEPTDSILGVVVEVRLHCEEM